jgi:hypothetical protein
MQKSLDASLVLIQTVDSRSDIALLELQGDPLAGAEDVQEYGLSDKSVLSRRCKSQHSDGGSHTIILIP